jgi:RecA-family ATPase
MGNLTMAAITEHASQMIEKVSTFNGESGLFLIKTGNQWIVDAKGRPIPQMLFSEFWHEAELCILFADTNQGKSILAVQIADSISKGQPIPGFKMQAQRQPVLIFDFEMGDKQFELRYSDKYENHYLFDENFYRAEVDPDGDIPDGITFEEYLHESIETAIHRTGARILIIDNITYLKNENERAKDALPLMKHLKTLKNKYQLSILALAHTPKRDLTKPITRNDLSGSKMLINFCDSSFAIGESHQDTALKYLKQIKPRNTEIIYHQDNVITCELSKDYNFLGFRFLNFGREMEHLRQISETDRNAIIERAKELNENGYSQRQISHEMGISLGAVNKYLKI